jgi:small subunit ribosomal protein S6
MNNYELTLILDPEAKEDQKLLTKVKGWIEGAKGKVEKTDTWGVKDFAYPIKKLSQGLYVFLQFSLGADGTASFERRLRIEPGIVRYLLIRV